MGKYRIYQNASNTVVRVSPDGDRQEYYCPRGGGYVRYARTGGQVCRGLRSIGETLEADQDTILEVVRREHRRAMRNE